jgi:hypothetical protein
VQFKVTPVGGASFEAITKEALKGLREANREVGKRVAKVGKAAMEKGAPVMWGKRLGVKTKVDAWPDRAEVLFTPAPSHSGAWAMREKGTKPHDIYPRKGRQGRGGRPAALAVSGIYAANVWHPGSSGEGAWTKAGVRLEQVVTPVVEDTYLEALSG